MSTETTTEVTTQTSAPAASKPTKKVVKKAAAKKAAAKKSAKNGTKKVATASKPQQHGVDRDHDLKWNDKKVAIFKAMKKLNALDAGSACSAQDIAAKADVKPEDVRHYCYHAKAGGLVNVVQVEEIKHGYGFHLTKKGATLDPVAELKAQQAAKSK